MSSKLTSRILILLCFLSTAILRCRGQDDDYNYCSITSKHTMCLPKGFGPKCGKPLSRGVSEDEKEEILRLHNEYRAKVANGIEKRGRPGPQPSASDMEQIEWDDELAKLAQKHADQCKFAHECSKCRKVERYSVGQNLFIYKRTQAGAKTNWKTAIDAWYNEVTLFSRRSVKPFKFSAAIGHYSAMMWSNTNRMGCGLTEFREGKWFAKLYTCDYGPTGNYIGGQMYKGGRACTSCPTDSSCSKDYPGLCKSAQNRTMPSDLTSSNAIKYYTSKFGSKKSSPKRVFNRFFKTRKNGSSGRRRTVSRRTTRRPTIRNTRRRVIQRTTTTTRRTTTTTRPATTTTRPTTTTTKATTTRPTTTTATTTRPTTTKATTTRPTKTTTTAQTTTTKAEATTRAVARRPASAQKSNAVSDPGNTLFSCDFESMRNCYLTMAGARWTKNTVESNTFYENTLEPGDRAEIVFNKMVSPPKNGIICLSFRYRKYGQGRETVPLQALAWPFRGKPGKVNIEKESPNGSTWIRANITFRKINKTFLVLFRVKYPKGSGGELELGIDDISVSKGECPESTERVPKSVPQ